VASGVDMEADRSPDPYKEIFFPAPPLTMFIVSIVKQLKSLSF
jgi:hypothetical protein